MNIELTGVFSHRDGSKNANRNESSRKQQTRMCVWPFQGIIYLGTQLKQEAQRFLNPHRYMI